MMHCIQLKICTELTELRAGTKFGSGILKKPGAGQKKGLAPQHGD